MSRKSCICAITAAVLCLSSCSLPFGLGEKEGEETITTADSTLNVKVRQDTIGDVKTEEELEPEEIKTDNFEIENNISDKAEFNKLNIGGREVDIYFLDCSQIYDRTNLEFNNREFMTDQNELYNFTGAGYSRLVREGDDIQYGTTIYLQSCKAKDHSYLIPNIEESNYLPEECVIKSVYIPASRQQKDVNVILYGNIQIGDDRAGIENKISAGTPLATNVAAYRNSKNTLIIVYNKDNQADRFLIINNEPE